MSVFVVTRGYPPSGRFGLEHYSSHLARGLAREGRRVVVLHPAAGPAASREDHGVSVRTLPAGGAKAPFAAEYRSAAQDSGFAAELAREKPEAVLFLSLGGGLSAGMIALAKDAGARVALSFVNFAATCYRGHFLTEEAELCDEGLDPARCSECVRRSSPYVRDHEKAESAERWAQRLEFLGERSPYVSRGEFAKRLLTMRDALARVDVFLSSSEAVRDRAVQWGIPAGKFRMAPRAFDPSLYEGFVRTPRAGSFRFGFVGQYAPHKGLHILIDAVRGLYGHRRDFTLALHGAPSGALHPDYGVMMIERGKKLSLPIEDRGPFAPEDTAKVFAGLDAVVIPSTWMESLPVTLLHAKATRTPVIATNVPGIREFVRNGVDGVMVTPGNSTSLAERMEKLMADPEMVKKFSDTSSLPETFADHVGKVEAALTGK